MTPIDTPAARQARAAAHVHRLQREAQAAVQYAAARGALRRGDIPSAVAHLALSARRAEVQR